MTTKVAAPTVPIFLAGEFVEAGTPLEVRNPANDELVATTFQAGADELEVGGVIINDIPTWRTDSMPYGGVNDSGLGREGLRWSIEDMTEPRLLAFGRTPVS